MYTQTQDVRSDRPERTDEAADPKIDDAGLDVEELEPVIAPKLAANHNETFLA
jgi:hypothetical protein